MQDDHAIVSLIQNFPTNKSFPGKKKEIAEQEYWVALAGAVSRYCHHLCWTESGDAFEARAGDYFIRILRNDKNIYELCVRTGAYACMAVESMAVHPGRAPSEMENSSADILPYEISSLLGDIYRKVSMMKEHRKEK